MGYHACGRLLIMQVRHRGLLCRHLSRWCGLWSNQSMLLMLRVGRGVLFVLARLGNYSGFYCWFFINIGWPCNILILLPFQFTTYSFMNNRHKRYILRFLNTLIIPIVRTRLVVT